jgi:hypothetical protein
MSNVNLVLKLNQGGHEVCALCGEAKEEIQDDGAMLFIEGTDDIVCFQCGVEHEPHLAGVLVPYWNDQNELADEDDNESEGDEILAPETNGEDDVFCLAAAVTEMGAGIPSVEMLVEHDLMEEEDAVFNVAVFDEAFIGFQSIVDRFGCSSDGVAALKGVITYYSKMADEADKHERKCEDKLRDDSERLDKLIEE